MSMNIVSHITNTDENNSEQNDQNISTDYSVIGILINNSGIVPNCSNISEIIELTQINIPRTTTNNIININNN